MIHLNVQTARRDFGSQIHRARVHRFVIMVADNDHQSVLPVAPKSFKDFGQSRIRRATLLKHSVTQGSTQMTNRIHLVQLHENELCMSPIHRIQRIHHRPVRAITQLASRGALGQNAVGWPVFIGLFGTANTHQILVAEEAKTF